MAESTEANENIEFDRTGKNKQLRKDSDSFGKRGVCYLSRVPPHMDPSNLRQILWKFGEIQRIYLAPEDPTVLAKCKQSGGFRGKEFSEGWVEFTKKSVAKKVANMLNGEQIGGKRRSSFYYDIWNIKYLSKFKWEDLTEEIANKNHIREQKLALEISSAKRERDFYLSKVDQSRALQSIQERLKKGQAVVLFTFYTMGRMFAYLYDPLPAKQKTRKSEFTSNAVDVQEPKIIRKFPQNKLVNASSIQSNPGLSKDFLTGVFGAGS